MKSLTYAFFNTKHLTLTLPLTLSLALFSCNSDEKQSASSTESVTERSAGTDTHLIDEVNAEGENGYLHAVIEIPAGSVEKWEVNKTTGKLEREIKDGKPRTINYLGYPGNYGFIPQTLLSKENGGDGDPLDVLVIGYQCKQAEIVPCKIIGVLRLLDNGEQDDKLIAVQPGGPFSEFSDIDSLAMQYPKVLTSIENWFSNYKGLGQMISNGFGNAREAMKVVSLARSTYEALHPKR